MAFKTELFDNDSVIEFYQNASGSNYKIYCGTAPKKDYSRDTYIGEDKNEGADQLNTFLKNLQKNKQNDNRYFLQVIDDDGNSVGVVFQLFEQATAPAASVAGLPADYYFKQMCEMNAAILSKLSAQEVEDEEEEEKPKGIAGVLMSEQYQPYIMAALGAIIQKFTSNNNNNMQPNNVFNAPQALAGTPEQAIADQYTKIEQAVNILINYDKNLGDHLQKLADMAQNNNAQFNMLIKML